MTTSAESPPPQGISAAAIRDTWTAVRSLAPSGRRRFVLELQVAVAKAMAEERFGALPISRWRRFEHRALATE
ncbi:hypothetical protein ACLMAL_13870 [Nocardia sp. CWNU-33]|uniref:hypothetical protein n=1 Tax=Nocardia sp. CWNU-33 TaxID=3392117 RepID=UPI00398E7B3E